MNRLRQILKDRRGVAFPPDYCHCAGAGNADVLHQRIFPSAHRGPGVRDAVQEAVISTVNDNYDDVYHGVREATPAPTSVGGRF